MLGPSRLPFRARRHRPLQRLTVSGFHRWLILQLFLCLRSYERMVLRVNGSEMLLDLRGINDRKGYRFGGHVRVDRILMALCRPNRHFRMSRSSVTWASKPRRVSFFVGGIANELDRYVRYRPRQRQLSGRGGLIGTIVIGATKAVGVIQPTSFAGWGNRNESMGKTNFILYVTRPRMRLG